MNNIEKLAGNCGEYVNGEYFVFYPNELEAFAKAYAEQQGEVVATAVYEIYAGLDNWREVSKAEYDDYKRTKRMLVPANANDFCYAELQAVYDEMYVHKDVARVANQLYKLIHSRTIPPSTVTLEEHNKRIAELEADIDTYVPIANQQATEIMQLQATNKTLLDALKAIEFATKPEPDDGSFHENAYTLAQQAIAEAEGVEG